MILDTEEFDSFYKIEFESFYQNDIRQKNLIVSIR